MTGPAFGFFVPIVQDSSLLSQHLGRKHRPGNWSGATEMKNPIRDTFRALTTKLIAGSALAAVIGTAAAQQPATPAASEPTSVASRLERIRSVLDDAQARATPVRTGETNEHANALWANAWWNWFNWFNWANWNNWANWLNFFGGLES